MMYFLYLDSLIFFGYFHFLMRIQYSKKQICRCRRPLHHKSCIFCRLLLLLMFLPYPVIHANIFCILEKHSLRSKSAVQRYRTLDVRVCLGLLIIMMLYNLRITKCKDGSHILEYDISFRCLYFCSSFRTSFTFAFLFMCVVDTWLFEFKG